MNCKIHDFLDFILLAIGGSTTLTLELTQVDLMLSIALRVIAILSFIWAGVLRFKKIKNKSNEQRKS